MDTSHKLLIWTLATLTFLFLYVQKKKSFPTLTSTINLSLASAGLVISMSLFWSLLSSSKLRQALEPEIGFDIIALYIGIFAAGWVSLQPIVQFLQPDSLEGKIEPCNLSEIRIFYYNLSCANKQVYKVAIVEDIVKKLVLMKNSNILINQPEDLVGKKVSIKDVAPINNGKEKELRVTNISQILIKK